MWFLFSSKSVEFYHSVHRPLARGRWEGGVHLWTAGYEPLIQNRGWSVFLVEVVPICQNVKDFILGS